MMVAVDRVVSNAAIANVDFFMIVILVCLKINLGFVQNRWKLSGCMFDYRCKIAKKKVYLIICLISGILSIADHDFPNGFMIDLHCHSHYSDGALSPEVLLEKALQAGVKMLALTDHDTTAGLASLQHAARDTGVKIINGIEFSTRWKKHDIHILGLNIKPEDEGLCALVEQQNEHRIDRAKKIAACLAEAGVHDAYEKACDIAGHDRIARPHFAQILINEGLVKDMEAAFKRFLGRGRGAFVPTAWSSIPEVVSGIIQAGGDAVIAHPLKYKLTRSKLHALVSEFKAAGGAALEVVSGEMMVTQITELAGLCLRFELLASTGSDFHHEMSGTGLGRQKPLPINCTPVWHHWTI